MIIDSSYTTPWALTDLFLWICWNRLFSRSPFISALRAAHSGLSGNTDTFRPKLLINSLLINCRVKLTGTSREECAGSTIPVLKLGRSPAPSSGPFQLARVPSARDEILCRHTLICSSAYHPQTIGQTERVNQILEDMLRACVISSKGSWEDWLPLAEFSYNNSYQESIKMALFEALYGRKCRTPLNWI